MDVGSIYRHDRFYVDDEGQLHPKYFLVLALTPQRDIIARLLTSRGSRHVDPRCFHGDPYPAFYLGVLGAPLVRDTWLDLRFADDFDADHAAGGLRKGVIRFVTMLEPVLLAEAMACAASAPDTTRQQERCIRDSLTRLR